jgi:hypothetical protein
MITELPSPLGDGKTPVFSRGPDRNVIEPTRACPVSETRPDCLNGSDQEVEK